MSFAELFIIALVALFVIKRQHLPGIARFIGAIVRQCQYVFNQFQHTVETELQLEQLAEKEAQAEAIDKLYADRANKDDRSE